VSTLHCIDPAAGALEVARRNLAAHDNCRFHPADADTIPLPDNGMDFGFALGVLPHVPDPAAALRACMRKLKLRALFLVYLYYAFDNRPLWYRVLWRASDLLRRVISRLPYPVRHGVSQVLALGICWPLARMAALVERLGGPAHAMPLAYYRYLILYAMRTDALDRFGTRLEHRFRRDAIQASMEGAGLEGIRFNAHAPYWWAVGIKVETARG
jgi:SAM-dependent methyltransferase